MSNNKVLNAIDVCNLLDISYPTFMRQLAQTRPEERPRRYKNNKREVYYCKEEILDWYEKLMLDE